MRGHAASKLLLGHAPVPGGSGGAPKNDRRVTGKASLTVRRMDGSGRSEASPATAYSVFTAWKMNSANFVMPEFSEVRRTPVQ